MAENVLRIADALEHQVEEDQSPARFKLWHHSRRWGKDRLGFKAAMVGHGPIQPNGHCLLPGALFSGKWVGWVVRDFTQGSNAWRAMFMPRLAHLRPNVSINKSEMRVTLPGGGGIFMCTAENIDSLRGLGEDMIGLVVNEAAWFDLDEAWVAVLRALLTDNKGWAILMSTPNSGLDGNQQGITPSYFNRLCHAAYAGSLGPEWAVFGGDLRENPKIDPEEAESFLRDLTPGSLRYKEEGLGLLVKSGAGLAFPNWSPKVHLTPWFTPDPESSLVLGMDWGISDDNLAAIVACRYTPRGRLIAFREWTWTGLDAYAAGFEFAESLATAALPRWPDQMVADSAMNERTGVGGGTIMTEFQSGINDALQPFHVPPLAVIGAPKGPGSRKVMFNTITKMLAWGPELANGTVPATKMPLFQIMLDQMGKPTCPVLAADLATAPKMLGIDEVDKKKAKFAAGDAFGYLLAMVLPQADPTYTDVPQDRHPGFLPTGKQRSRDRSPEVVARERDEVAEFMADRMGEQLGGRYGRRPRR